MNTEMIDVKDWGSVTTRDDLSPMEQAALARFSEIGYPNLKQEIWKYCKAETWFQKPFSPIGGAEVSVLQGPTPEPSGSTLASAESFIKEGLATETNPFLLMNRIESRHPVKFCVPAGTTLSDPILLELNGGESGSISNPQIQIELEAGATAELYVTHSSAPNNFCNAVFDLVLGEGASLSMVLEGAQNEATGIGFDSVRTQLGAKSRFDLFSVTGSAELSRSDVQVEVRGEESHCSLNGVAILSGAQRLFVRTLMNHHIGNATSQQLFKHVLSDKALSEYNGRVYVARKAHGTDASQSNKNLLLSKGARALARPQLNIFADDVLCAHGASMGQLDDEQVFYLKSRGFTDGQAKAVLLKGFVDEVLLEVPSTDARERLAPILEHALQQLEAE